jgi:hypothetical protein
MLTPSEPCRGAGVGPRGGGGGGEDGDGGGGGARGGRPRPCRRNRGAMSMYVPLAPRVLQRLRGRERVRHLIRVERGEHGDVARQLAARRVQPRHRTTDVTTAAAGFGSGGI